VEGARRALQIIRATMLFSILIYGVMIKLLPSNARPNLTIYYVIIVVAVWILVGLFRFRRKLIKPSESILVNNPGDPLALKQWRTGYLLTYAFSEAIAVYGILLHFLGFGTAQVLPFLIVGAVLILFYSPRLP
jgi:hypothetical protein